MCTGHQPCALPPWNDRSFQLEGEDLTFNLCFGTCGLGKCSSLAHHVTTKVIFEIDMNSVDLQGYQDKTGAAFEHVRRVQKPEGRSQLLKSVGASLFVGSKQPSQQ